MKSLTPNALIAVSTIFLATNAVLAADNNQVGCYKAKGSLEKADSFTYQSIGHCRDLCLGKGKPLLGLTDGSDCYCGEKIPSKSSKTDDDDCDSPCDGYPQNICGGDDAFSIYLTGKKKLKDIDTEDGDGGGNGGGGNGPTSSDSGDGPTTTTKGGETVIVTESSSSQKEDDSDDDGPNTAGIAAGVVVGVVAVIAIIGGVWFFMRRRRQKALEDEHNRSATIDNFVAGGKPNSSSSMSDSRLDPAMMAHRRQSDGSIADNQDFSRRILQVTNPDGH